MKRCPKCQVEFSDRYKFCQTDGAILIEVFTTTPIGSAAAAPARVRAGGDDDVERTRETLNQPQVAPSIAGDDERIQKYHLFALAKRHLLLLIIITVIVVAGVAAAIYFGGNSIEEKLEGAIAKGNLFSPSGESAYDYYQQLKRGGVSANTLARFDDTLIPLLTQRSRQMLSDLATPGKPEPMLAVWEEAQRQMKWASEIKPNDRSMAARSIYCAGRVAYLNGRKDEAMDLWKRAADLDATWAIPSNGVGLIYNERKDYSTAREYLFEAIRRDPKLPLPYNNIGTSFFFEKNDDQAEYYYRQAIERAPQWPRPHAWLGDIAMRRKDYSRAVTEYEAAINLDAAGATGIDIEKLRGQLERARRLSLY